MKTIKPSKPIGANGVHWPRHQVKTVECRKKDLVVRITDWMKDRYEPGYDVEVYVGGVYDWNESKSFTMHALKDEALAKRAAITFAQNQIAKLL